MTCFLAAIKLFGEICLWFSCGGAVLSLFAAVGNLLPAALLHGLGGGLALLLERKDKRLRYLGLIPPALSLLVGSTVPQFLLLIPALGYSGVAIHRCQLRPDYNDLYNLFYPTAAAALVGGLICGIQNVNWGVAAAFLYLCILLFLQRVHRHQNQETWDLRLLILEGSLLGVLCVIGLLLSQQTVLTALKEGLILLGQLIGVPIVTVLGLILYGVVWVFGKLISFLRGDGSGVTMSGLPEINLSGTDWLGQEAVASASPAALWVVRIIAILAFLTIGGLLLRKLLQRRGTGVPPEGGRDSRSLLRVGALPLVEKPPKRTDRSPEARVRRAFASYCKALSAAGITLTPGCTSREVNGAAGEFGKLPQAVRLRELYLRARYTSRSGLTAADGREAAELAKELKKLILAR